MTPIDYLLAAGTVLAGGYLVARLFIGWLRSPDHHAGIEPDRELDADIIPERIEKTGTPWGSRK